MHKVATPQELVPGNYYFFELFIEIKINGITHLGYPQRAIRDMGTNPPLIRWCSPTKLCWPNPAVPRGQWIDVPTKGLSERTIASPEDVLGAEGKVGDKTYLFERILDAGKHKVVFRLFCPENQTSTAYGFPREMFQNAEF